MATASVGMRQYGSRVVSSFFFRESHSSRFLGNATVLSTGLRRPSECIGSLNELIALGITKTTAVSFYSGAPNAALTSLSKISLTNEVGNHIRGKPIAGTFSVGKPACFLKGKLAHGNREDSICAKSLKPDVLCETVDEQPVELPQPGGTTLSSEWHLSQKQLTQVDTFVDLLLEWNQRMNLTAVTERAAVMERHIVDSLALLPIIDHALLETSEDIGTQNSLHPLPLNSNNASSPSDSEPSSNKDNQELEQAQTRVAKKKDARRKKKHKDSAEDLEAIAGEISHQAGAKRLRVIDVGTGAGLPGLVFAIARPEWDLVLVESLRKRCTFLEEVVRVAGLANVSIVWGRAEDTVRLPNMRASADVAVARAVADLRVLSELCIPYVRKGGLFFAPKGPTPEDEVAAALGAIEMLGGRVLGTEKVASSGPGGQRTAVVCVKERPTPAKYPRRAGVPAKCPL